MRYAAGSPASIRVPADQSVSIITSCSYGRIPEHVIRLRIIRIEYGDHKGFRVGAAPPVMDGYRNSMIVSYFILGRRPDKRAVGFCKYGSCRKRAARDAKGMRIGRIGVCRRGRYG